MSRFKDLLPALLAVAAFAGLALAGGPLHFNSSGPVVWKTDQPIPYKIDRGPFRSIGRPISSEDVTAHVQAAFAVWSAVPTASIRFQFDGHLDEDVQTPSQFLSLAADEASGNWVVLDQDGSIVDGLLGVGNSHFVLGFAQPIAGDSHIVRFQSLMNGKLARSAKHFLPTFIHEFGHAVGLDHSQIHAALANDGDSDNDVLVPIMFPTSTDSEDSDDPPARPLHGDDKAWISLLYPSSRFQEEYGVLVGRVVRQDTQAPVLGANVVAIDVTDGGRRFSCVSDYLKGNTGAFRIPVPPGKYKLRIEPIRAQFTGGSSVGPYAETNTDHSFTTVVRPNNDSAVHTITAGNSSTEVVLTATILGQVVEDPPRPGLADPSLDLKTLAAPTIVWQPRGPGPNTRGQVENITDGEVVGAINTVAVHPGESNVVYVGAVNGGIWTTNNAMNVRPTWQRQTDSHQSLSIGAIEFDPTDHTHRTLVAGTGRFSSFLRQGGARAGLLRTTNGTTWMAITGGGTLNGLNVAGVAPRGSTIVLAANAADNFANVGIWRSINTGANWTKISGATGTGLPTGACSDLAGDPGDVKRLFTNAGPNGIYRSTDTGATWTKVSSPAMDALIAAANNVKISVGPGGVVYAGIVRANQLAGVFRSPNGGTTWVAMGVPTTSEGGAHPGGQGGIHFSLLADARNANLVYVGGDRQPSPFPNSIAARDYSGRLFRGDASKPAGSQWTHLTHANNQGASGGGTANSSAPHADSRDMAMAANGVLIEVDDGGIYRRTSPQTNTGDWFSMNGDLQVTEFHSVAYDPISRILVGGAQDTGSPEQTLTSNPRWRSISTADGGMVAVAAFPATNLSTRYTSNQFLGGFRRRVFNASNVLQSQVFPAMTLVGGGPPLSPQFYTPLKVNTVTPTRLVIGGGNSVYESLDQGDTVREIGPGIVVNGVDANPIAYGAANNANVLYVGSNANVFVRTAAHPAALIRSTSYQGTQRVVGIAIDPGNANTAYVVDASQVYRTTNAAGSWIPITGNLPSLAPGTIRSVALSTSTPRGSVVVGTDTGVYSAAGPNFTSWSRLGKALPRVPVYHVEYHPASRVLVAGTLGRGAWTTTLPSLVPHATVKSGEESKVQPAEFRAGSAEGARASKESKTSTVELRNGVMVDPGRSQVYVMTPEGGVEALDLAKGNRVWNSEAASKPLGVADSRLLAQTEYSGAGNTLKIVLLNPEDGKEVRSATAKLPANVRPTVTETLHGEFVARVRPSDGAPLVSWQYFERPRKGVPPGTEDALPPGGQPPPLLVAPPAGGTVSGGTLRIDLDTGATTAVSGADVRLRRGATALEVPPLKRIAGLPEEQYLSADGRHVLVSRETGPQTAWDRYVLTVYELESKKRLGEWKSHVSVVPFFVTDSRVLFTDGPYARRGDTGLVEEPLKLRAVDLTTSKEVWNRPVRDTSFRGPFPP